MPKDLQATVLLAAMDDQTEEHADITGVDTGDYKALKKFVEQRYANQQARKVVLGRKKRQEHRQEQA